LKISSFPSDFSLTYATRVKLNSPQSLKRDARIVEKSQERYRRQSIDAVVNWLLNKHLDQGDADGAAGMEEEEADGAQKKRKLNVRDPLYSLEILSVREGMLLPHWI
jgi:hypothetical protein